MKVACIDFETANNFIGSICAVGVAIVEDGRVADSRYWLVKPHRQCAEFDYFNIQIHGIRPQDVAHAPEFDEVYAELLPLIEGAVLAAHNAPFDMSALRHVLGLYSLPNPTAEYLCTCRVAAKVWADLDNHRLNTVAAHIGHTFRHHDALEDAVACAEVLLAAQREKHAGSTAELMAGIGLKHGTIFPGGYTPCGVVARAKGTRR